MDCDLFTDTSTSTPTTVTANLSVVHGGVTVSISSSVDDSHSVREFAQKSYIDLMF